MAYKGKSCLDSGYFYTADYVPLDQEPISWFRLIPVLVPCFLFMCLLFVCCRGWECWEHHERT